MFIKFNNSLIFQFLSGFCQSSFGDNALWDFQMIQSFEKVILFILVGAFIHVY